MSEKEYPDILELYAMWRNSGLTPIAIIEGWSKLLLDGLGEELTEEQRRAVEVIHRNALRAVDCWNHPMHYLELCHDTRPVTWEAIPLSQIIQRALHDLHKFAPTVKAQVFLPEPAPLIRGNHRLAIAIFNLIYPPSYDSPLEDFAHVIKAGLGEASQVLVQIQVGVQFSDEQIKNPSKLLYPGSRRSVSDLIVRQYGSQITVHPLDQGVEFRFELPLWEEKSHP